LLEQPLNLLLNTFDCSSVHPPSEAPLPNLVKWWIDAMWPNEVVDIDAFMIIDHFLTGNALLNNKHLSGYEAGRPTLTRGGRTWQMSATLNIRLLSSVFCASMTQGRSTSFAEYILSPTWKRALRESALKY
jgi:hypothetical protein